MMTTITFKSIREEVLQAYKTAKAADNEWQAELDRLGVDRYSKASHDAASSALRELYDKKVAADARLAELTDTMQRYQDVRQVLG